MKEFFDGLDKDLIIDLALILGVIILSLNGVDGWGWLIFILILRQ